MPCPCCGQQGLHFVSSAFGAPGYFSCQLPQEEVEQPAPLDVSPEALADQLLLRAADSKAAEIEYWKSIIGLDELNEQYLAEILELKRENNELKQLPSKEFTLPVLYSQAERGMIVNQQGKWLHRDDVIRAALVAGMAIKT